MKRDKSLQPLSLQHHDELLSCLLIKKGVQKKAAIVLLADFTNAFWKDDLQKHINAEEELLIPFLVKNKFENRYINIMRTDHSIIRSVFDRLNTFDNRHKVFEIFAVLVEQHIRFEERFIFEKVQEVLSQNEMEELGVKLKEIKYRKCTDYPIKFWE
ncbi:MAG: hemerythrin domain-containing protein [Chitinophagaceae bacterium]